MEILISAVVWYWYMVSQKKARVLIQQHLILVNFASILTKLETFYPPPIRAVPDPYFTNDSIFRSCALKRDSDLGFCWYPGVCLWKDVSLRCWMLSIIFLFVKPPWQGWIILVLLLILSNLYKGGEAIWFCQGQCWILWFLIGPYFVKAYTDKICHNL